MNITVQYFAILREQAGVGQETVETDARSPQALYGELAQKHGFSLDGEVLKVALNSEFSSMSEPLKDGDTIVFIPPVAGG